ncbi:MAG: flagellar basal body P-ring formation chaperone FlgA [Gemmatimonadaceae bacterium]
MRPSWLRRVIRWIVIGAVPAGALATGRAQAQQDSTSVLVAARALPRGAVLRSSDMTLARRPVHGARGTDSRPEPGWITRRVIRAGEELAAPAVTPAPTIAVGATVRYVVTRGALELALPAVALTAASTGQTIAVRLSTPPARRATGIVAGPLRVIAPSDLRDAQ